MFINFHASYKKVQRQDISNLLFSTSSFHSSAQTTNSKEDKVHYNKDVVQ